MVSEGDTCQIDLGGAQLTVRIVGFHGADVALIVLDRRPAVDAELRVAGKAHLLLPTGDGTRAQPGTVIYSGRGDLLVFRTSDAVYEGLKRMHSRAPLRLELLIAPVAAAERGARVRTDRTLDVGAGGVRLPHWDDALERCRLMITLPDATRVNVLGRLNRTGGADTVYAFERLTAQDRSRISGFVLGWHIDRLREG